MFSTDLLLRPGLVTSMQRSRRYSDKLRAACRAKETDATLLVFGRQLLFCVIFRRAQEFNFVWLVD